MSRRKRNRSSQIPFYQQHNMAEVEIEKGKTIRVDLTELGRTGLSRFSGLVYEEHIKELKGAKGARIFKRMSMDDAVIASVVYAIKMLIRQVDWYVNPGGEKLEDRKKADFLKYNMDNMSMSWNDVISEVMSMLIYGWSFHEIVYKRDTNGRICWRKLPIRAQESLRQWDFDKYGGIEAFQQYTLEGEIIKIPMEKGLLFRTEITKNNPEGRSLVRGAYRAWYNKSNLEDIEGIGFERGLAGYPVMYAPPQILSPNARPEEKALFEQLKKIVTGIKVDEMAGLVLPAEEIGNMKTGFKFELKAPNTGKGGMNINEAINRYRQEIAMTMLGDFLLLGHGAVGSYSLSSDKTNLFAMSIKALLDIICTVFNKYAVPRLFAVNSFKEGNLPKIKYTDIESPDLKNVGFFIQSLAAGGLITYDKGLENHVREMANLPPISDEGRLQPGERPEDAIKPLANPTTDKLPPADQRENGDQTLPSRSDNDNAIAPMDGVQPKTPLKPA